ncbi:family 10 glycosylhydrolase [Aestuariivivens sediminis]|uniref:family 10 glycosylhydrolase n=1 Tax=Aestuariivivens sediminis TaxID=2913557 RepID=UPI001F57BEEE|nr:family 10 glycosylhydrolase [Aestuariivivens sediminis]
MIQTNLPAAEGALNPDSLVVDLLEYSANTLLINAGGIMAFYPTKLPFHYQNPYVKDDMLGRVISLCHANGIRVIVRFDFSRAHESFLEEHPDWFYLSPQGSRADNYGMIVTSVNGEYMQKHAFEIVQEVIDNYPIDGMFINMFGYKTTDYYHGIYHGIDQNKNDKRRFEEFSNGMTLPTVEDSDDPVFQKYVEFKEFTTNELLERMHNLIKSQRPNIALCTYNDDFIDIMRHEAQGELHHIPYFAYIASENVNTVEATFDDKISSSSSIQQITFGSRYHAVPPVRIRNRLYQNIAHGSGLDISLMGDMRNYEDERGFGVIKEVYAYHKNNEKYYGDYKSTAQIAIIKQDYWPGGPEMEEMRGIEQLLKEEHVQFDLILKKYLSLRFDKLKDYKIILIAHLNNFSDREIEVLKKLTEEGVNIIATNQSMADNPEALKELFGATVIEKELDAFKYYLQLKDQDILKRQDKLQQAFLKCNFMKCEFDEECQLFLPLLDKGREGPPEMIGGHVPTGWYGISILDRNSAKTVYIPWGIGRMYYQYGFFAHRDILLDVIDFINPEIMQDFKTSAPPQVEITFNKFRYNSFATDSYNKYIINLINLSGFNGRSYFEPLEINNINFEIKVDLKPEKVYGLKSGKTIKFEGDSIIKFTLDSLWDFEAIVIE